MRNYLILAFVSLAFFACTKPTPTDHGPGTCMITCTNPAIKIQLPSMGGDSLSKVRLRRYRADGTYSLMLEQTTTSNIYITPDYDWDIVMLDSSKVYRIGYLKIEPRQQQSYCGDECANTLTTISVLYLWHKHYFKWELTGKKEYTVIL